MPDRQPGAMNSKDHKLTTRGEFDAVMRQKLSAPGDAMPPSENREPTREELNRRYRFRRSPVLNVAVRRAWPQLTWLRIQPLAGPH